MREREKKLAKLAGGFLFSLAKFEVRCIWRVGEWLYAPLLYGELLNSVANDLLPL
jgi:hypothetical protein